MIFLHNAFAMLAALILPAPKAPKARPPLRTSKKHPLLPASILALAQSAKAWMSDLGASLCKPNITTRAGSLYDRMEHFAYLAMPRKKGKTNNYKARARIFNVPGYCYARLFTEQWIVPAVATLGPYPSAADVLRLAPYFRDGADHTFLLYQAGNKRALHISGSRNGAAYRTSLLTSLASHGISAVGADHPMGEPDVHRYFSDRAGQPPTAPRGTRARPYGGPGSSSSRGRARMTPAPFKPYPDPNRGRRTPPPPPQQWQAATRDAFNDRVDELKLSLTDLTADEADTVWQSFLRWLAALRQTTTFTRAGSLDQMADYLTKLKADAISSRIDIPTLSNRLSALVAELTDCEEDYNAPRLGQDPADIMRRIEALRMDIRLTETTLESLEAAADPPAPATDDPFAAGQPYIPVPEPEAQDPAESAPISKPWPEENFTNFEERVRPLYPKAGGKPPITTLDPVMEEPKASKFLIPRPLEIYSSEEINSIAPRGTSPWHNRYDDPQEPTKCWSREKFTEIYERPGFHFMVARLALYGVAANDPKLTTLQSLLTERWSCRVNISRMNPRQDWMLCTIPDTAGPRAEILDAALIRLHSGNVSYVVRLFNEPSRIRDLDIAVPGAMSDPNAIFSKLKKALIEYEENNVELGWRVIGVRKTVGIGKFRGTFALDSTSTYWPWAMKYGHLHGSIPPQLPLLNFEPTWLSKKPYACQSCFNSDHYIVECPSNTLKSVASP
jgi:hypothetical protein